VASTTITGERSLMQLLSAFLELVLDVLIHILFI
jgi:hypothetical protein